MAYFKLPRNYSMNDLMACYKNLIRKYHPNRTGTSTHFYRINSEFSQKKSLLRMRDEALNVLTETEVQRAICQCGHFYDVDKIKDDIIECSWCSIKVHIIGRNKLN